jgi:hypothetical protein
MAGMYPSADRSALTAWLHWLGLDEPDLSPEARDLLLIRKAVRRSATFRVAPLFALALAFFGYWMHRAWTEPVDHEERWPALASATMVIVALMVWREIVRRDDRRAARGLARRVSRPAAPSLTTVLGRGPTAAIVLAAVVTPAMAVALFVRHQGATAWLFTLTAVAAWLFAAFGLARAHTRPTIALDAFTLVVDDRLRSSDATCACIPLGLALEFFGGADALGRSAWLDVVVFGTPFVVLVLIGSGWPRNRYRPRPPSAPPSSPPKAPLPLQFR